MNIKEMYDKIRPFIKSSIYPKMVQRNPGIEKKLDELDELLKSSVISHDFERAVYEFIELCGEEVKNLKKEKQAG